MACRTDSRGATVGCFGSVRTARTQAEENAKESASARNGNQASAGRTVLTVLFYQSFEFPDSIVVAPLLEEK